MEVSVKKRQFHTNCILKSNYSLHTGAGGGWDSIFEEQQSSKVLDIDTAQKLFTAATQITGAEWIDPKEFVALENENLVNEEDAVTVNGKNVTLSSM